jgi:hypothetical protein
MISGRDRPGVLNQLFCFNLWLWHPGTNANGRWQVVLAFCMECDTGVAMVSSKATP